MLPLKDAAELADRGELVSVVYGRTFCLEDTTLKRSVGPCGHFALDVTYAWGYVAHPPWHNCTYGHISRVISSSCRGQLSYIVHVITRLGQHDLLV